MSIKAMKGVLFAAESNTTSIMSYHVSYVVCVHIVRAAPGADRDSMKAVNSLEVSESHPNDSNWPWRRISYVLDVY